MKKIFGFFVMAAVALTSVTACSDDDDDNNGGTSSTSGTLILSASPNIIKADGEDYAVISVTLNGEDVTAASTIYDASTNVPVSFTDGKFSTTTADTYSFWASYGAKSSSTLQIFAISSDLPTAPDDPQTSSTDFHKKLMIAQFTGSGCQYCPYMVSAIKNLASDEEYADNFVHVGVHSYNSTDAAYNSDWYDMATDFGVNDESVGYPCACLDMYMLNTYYQETYFRAYFDQVYSRSETVSAGVSATCIMDVTAGQIVVRASVKAAEEGDFRLGAWLVEDNIYSSQQVGSVSGLTLGDYDYDYHDNCLRIADSNSSTGDWSGFSVGTLAAGGSADYIFAWDINSKWDTDELHVIVFASMKESRGYSVVNAIDCPTNGSVAYQYEE